MGDPLREIADAVENKRRSRQGHYADSGPAPRAHSRSGLWDGATEARITRWVLFAIIGGYIGSGAWPGAPSFLPFAGQPSVVQPTSKDLSATELIAIANASGTKAYCSITNFSVHGICDIKIRVSWAASEADIKLDFLPPNGHVDREVDFKSALPGVPLAHILDSKYTNR